MVDKDCHLTYRYFSPSPTIIDVTHDKMTISPFKITNHLFNFHTYQSPSGSHSAQPKWFSFHLYIWNKGKAKIRLSWAHSFSRIQYSSNIVNASKCLYLFQHRRIFPPAMAAQVTNLVYCAGDIYSTTASWNHCTM